MVQSNRKTESDSAKVSAKVTPDPYFCRFHVATVGADGQINADTDYSKPYRFKACADDIADAGYSDLKLRTITVIIFE